MSAYTGKEPIWKAARNEAKKMLEKVGLKDHRGSVDVYRICAKLGIRVYTSNLPEHISGYIEQSRPNDKPFIIVNRNEVETRQRFTTAHELGHYAERRLAYHRGAEDGIYGFTDYRDQQTRDVHELFADEFAGELLMPAPQILSLKNEGKSEHEIAAYFDVSPTAVQVRLRRLDQDPYDG